MSLKEIDEMVEQFVQGARLAKASGFDGVELHASHGYQLSAFMSPNVSSALSSLYHSLL
jgi:2,4-dienoyl-CoA reductase-like NADH-dependent reductase (Old Yellow Enzyme family)